MPPRFASHIFTLGDLLSDPHEFRIPDYQRPYSWRVTEAAQLLEDINNAIAEGSKQPDDEEGYFLGSVLLIDRAPAASSDANPPSHHRVFDIVDGQQRLVTVTILLSVIRDISIARGSRSAD